MTEGADRCLARGEMRPALTGCGQDGGSAPSSKAARLTRAGRFSQSPLVLLVLKGLNSGLTAVNNFLLAYVLVRAIGLTAYAVIASLLAIAALVVQSDLGITGLTFYKLRSHHLGRKDRPDTEQDDRALVMAIVTVYVGIGIVSVALLGLALAVDLVHVGAYGLAYTLIFASAVCALPRMALRVAVNARDGFAWTEIVDLGRRLAILAITAAMLAGLSFTGWAVLNLAVWLLSIVALAWLAMAYGYVPDRGGIGRGLHLLRREFRGIRATVLLSLMDFAITVFPYYLLAATRDAVAIVAFDMFYKVTRFAVMSYLIGSETALPQQTRCFHEGDAAGLVRATSRGVAVGLLPMISGILAIAVFGDTIFGIILNHAGVVSPLMRVSICVMFVFMLVQTTCQIVLIGVGRFGDLARRASMTLAGMAAIGTLTLLRRWSFDEFITAYVIVYALGSLLYAECFVALVGSLRRQEPAGNGAVRQAGT